MCSRDGLFSAESGKCRGIVTADVLVQGLIRGAIATRKLKGVKRDKGHGVYTGLAPCSEGKILRSSFGWYCLCLDYQGANPLDLVLDLMLLVLSQPPGHPFIYRGRCPAAHRFLAGS